MRGNRVDASVTGESESTVVECPYCESLDTDQDHPKGPSLCRSMHYCNNCNQPFEKFE